MSNRNVMNKISQLRYTKHIGNIKLRQGSYFLPGDKERLRARPFPGFAACRSWISKDISFVDFRWTFVILDSLNFSNDNKYCLGVISLTRERGAVSVLEKSKPSISTITLRKSIPDILVHYHTIKTCKSTQKCVILQQNSQHALVERGHKRQKIAFSLQEV